MDADFVFFIYAGTPEQCTGTYAAMANFCYQDQTQGTNRPIAGWIDFCMFEPTTYEFDVALAVHETLHALVRVPDSVFALAKFGNFSPTIIYVHYEKIHIGWNFPRKCPSLI